jgi:hypothetical protein
VAASIAGLLAAGTALGAEPETGGGPAALITFDIPAQPLASALESYGAASGREVLYNAQLATGRVSNTLKGVFTAEAALPILLGGTGLAAHYTAQDAFVVVPAPADSVEREKAPATTDAAVPEGRIRYASYYGLVQQRIKDAFCGNAAIRPGGYRIALRFWIGPTGGVLRSKRLGTTGDPGRDLAIDNTMRSLTVDEAPPAGLAQPFTMVVLPRLAAATGDCAR